MVSEKNPKIENNGKISNLTQLMTEIGEKKIELLTKKGKERDDLELEIEMLETQHNARKKLLDDIRAGKIEK
jgi:hypothetical protein